MTNLAVLDLLFAGSTKSTTTKSGSADIELLVLLAVFAVVYMLFIRPKSQAAKRQRLEGAKFEVGDEIVTVGGIVGTVLDVTDERVTIVTGAASAQGAVGDPPPTRLVMVRQAIGRKLPSISAGDDDDDHDLHYDDDEEHDDDDEHDDGNDSSENHDGHTDGDGHAVGEHNGVDGDESSEEGSN